MLDALTIKNALARARFFERVREPTDNAEPVVSPTNLDAPTGFYMRELSDVEALQASKVGEAIYMAVDAATPADYVSAAEQWFDEEPTRYARVSVYAVGVREA